VKNVKDIRHNLDDLADSAQDNLYELFKELQSRQKTFYDQLEEILESVKDKQSISNVVQQHLKKNQEDHDEAISHLFSLLRENTISEVKVSTMLNVYREIHSSNKAFILAITELLKLKDSD
jgi:hypothetical protein